MNEPSNFCPGDVCWLPAAPPPPPATRNGSSGLRAGHPSAQPLHEQQEQQERQQQMQMQQRQQQQEQRRRQQMRADAVVAGSPGSPRTKTVGELRHSLRGGQVRQGATAAIQQQVRQGAAAAAATAATARVAGGAAGGDLGGDPAATAEATIALRAAPKGRRTAIGTAAVGNPGWGLRSNYTKTGYYRDGHRGWDSSGGGGGRGRGGEQCWRAATRPSCRAEGARGSELRDSVQAGRVRYGLNAFGVVWCCGCGCRLAQWHPVHRRQACCVLAACVFCFVSTRRPLVLCVFLRGHIPGCCCCCLTYRRV